MAQELSRAKEKNMTLIEDNRSLASQLVFHQEDAKTTSENLVIKDAEVMLLVMAFAHHDFASLHFIASRLLSHDVTAFILMFHKWKLCWCFLTFPEKLIPDFSGNEGANS